MNGHGKVNIQSYGLYQTFAPPEESGAGSPSKLPKKDLTSAQKKELLQKLGSLDHDQTEAVFMLICEHARRHDEFTFNPSEYQLPYGLEQKSKTIVFDLKELPVQLRWVLWRFSNVIKQPSNGEKSE